MQTEVAVDFRVATLEDVSGIVELVNSAYRGESSKAGWTTEADLLGGQRTDAEEIAGLITAQDSMLVLGFGETGILGSVHIEKVPGGAYLGMLTIQPTLQGLGLGKQFIAEAERIAVQTWQVQTMSMTVIPLRHELVAFYERRGYKFTGQVKGFPADPKFGIPKVAGLHLAIFEKHLGSTDRSLKIDK